MENTALVRRTHDNADDAIWFDPTLCVLDQPGVDADSRYVFVDPEDAVPRVFLKTIRPVEVPVGTTALKIPVRGVIYPATTQAEYSLNGTTWAALGTDTQTRIDAEITVPVDGTLGVKNLTLQVRPVDTENAVELPLTIGIAV